VAVPERTSTLGVENPVNPAVADSPYSIVEIDSSIGIVHPDFDFFPCFDGSCWVLYVNDAMLRSQPTNGKPGHIFYCGNARLPARRMVSLASCKRRSISRRLRREIKRPVRQIKDCRCVDEGLQKGVIGEVFRPHQQREFLRDHTVNLRRPDETNKFLHSKRSKNRRATHVRNLNRLDYLKSVLLAVLLLMAR
jgi:hypothetical protein